MPGVWTGPGRQFSARYPFIFRWLRYLPDADSSWRQPLPALEPVVASQQIRAAGDAREVTVRSRYCAGIMDEALICPRIAPPGSAGVAMLTYHLSA